MRLELEDDLAVLDRLAALRDEVSDRAAPRGAHVVPDAEHLHLSERVALLDCQARSEAIGIDEEADRRRGNADRWVSAHGGRGRHADRDGGIAWLGRADRSGGPCHAQAKVT